MTPLVMKSDARLRRELSKRAWRLEHQPAAIAAMDSPYGRFAVAYGWFRAALCRHRDPDPAAERTLAAAQARLRCEAAGALAGHAARMERDMPWSGQDRMFLGRCRADFEAGQPDRLWRAHAWLLAVWRLTEAASRRRDASADWARVAGRELDEAAAWLAGNAEALDRGDAQ